MLVIHDTPALKRHLQEWRGTGQRIALVPTMGALHDGHIALVKLAREHADRVILYIFVNPRQFGPKEDLARYPRTFDEDLARCKAASVDMVYAPSVDDVYPKGFTTTVSMGELGGLLEGKFRPGFFEGVATVLAKFFIRILPDVAVFGEKDYQQLQIVKRLVHDLDLPVEVIAAPTLREADGLAISSRNRYLSEEQRNFAVALYRTLSVTAMQIQQAPVTVQIALEMGKQKLLAAGFTKVDYLELCDPNTLQPQPTFTSPARLLAAAWIDTTRLIDNIMVE